MNALDPSRSHIFNHPYMKRNHNRQQMKKTLKIFYYRTHTGGKKQGYKHNKEEYEY